MSRPLKNAVYTLISVVVLVAIYIISYFLVANELIIPSPKKTLEETLKLLISADFYVAMAHTLLRVIIAVICSFGFALTLVFLSSKSKFFEEFSKITIGAMRSLPVLAVLLLILVAVSRTVAPVVVSVLSLLPILYTSIYTGIKRTKNELGDMMKVYKLSFADRVFKVYAPTMLPKLTLDITGAVSFALKLVISAEILANVYKSLGGVMQTASIYEETATLSALTISVLILGVIIEFVGNFISKRLGEY